MTESSFRFIDLFCGIGGIRLAFERAGGQCVFSSEIDQFARQTYQSNFNEEPQTDIVEVEETQVPDHEVLVAGFPCQPFSSAGKQKGFDDTRGNLFFHITRILKEKRPKAFLLENVKNLVSHDKGNTFKTILDVLHILGYTVHYKIMNSKYYVPQNRNRIFIVGFHNNFFKTDTGFQFPDPENQTTELPKLKDILEKEVEDKYTLSEKMWNCLLDHANKQKEKGNGFRFGLADVEGSSKTLLARYYKDGSEILIPQKDKMPRKLTPRECARLQGFPDTFVIPVSNTQAYKQFGNSVTVPLVEEIAKKIKEKLLSNNY